jgi:5-hydroxyisourate hydrolase-like protein (transthyretin family)
MTGRAGLRSVGLVSALLLLAPVAPGLLPAADALFGGGVLAAQETGAQGPQEPAPAAAAAQGAQTILRGLVIDAQGNPAPGVPIALHRVAEAGGALVAQVTSEADGSFMIPVPDSEPVEAMYFVAARHDGEFYIGPSLRRPFPVDSEYVVQIGVEATSASRMAQGVRPDEVFIRPPSSPWRWGIALTVFIATALFALFLLMRMRGPDPRRRLLIRIAELDEEQHGGEALPDEAYRAERDDLFDRLRTAD